MLNDVEMTERYTVLCQKVLLVVFLNMLMRPPCSGEGLRGVFTSYNKVESKCSLSNIVLAVSVCF